MSDIPADYQDRLNLREQLARIDRNQAEFQKLLAESTKLNAKARKFNRDFWFVILGALFAAIAGGMVRLPEILHAFGVGH